MCTLKHTRKKQKQKFKKPKNEITIWTKKTDYVKSIFVYNQWYQLISGKEAKKKREESNNNNKNIDILIKIWKNKPNQNESFVELNR